VAPVRFAIVMIANASAGLSHKATFHGVGRGPYLHGLQRGCVYAFALDQRSRVVPHAQQDTVRCHVLCKSTLHTGCPGLLSPDVLTPLALLCLLTDRLPAL
jgi:hypothetical protein